jgi:uncharacterized protein (DUF362 family)
MECDSVTRLNCELLVLLLFGEATPALDSPTPERPEGDPMQKSRVALVQYEKPLESVRKVVDLSQGLEKLPPSAKVFIKPNIVFWTRKVAFPKWGVITTSRVVEDMVVLLKERGVSEITIGEGTVVFDPKDKETALHSFEYLGYNVLRDRYGVKSVNVFERPFEKLDLGDGVVLKFSKEILDSDFVVNIPVLKTHAQAKVSLGIKNLKGMLDVNSRKKCHAADTIKDLDFWIARLADKIPPSFTILDGIYTIERGPGPDGKARKSNILIGSADVLSADMVGAKILGYEPNQVPHLVHAAKNRKRPMNLSDVEVLGAKIEDLASPHAYTFPYNESDTLPVPMEKMGIKGLSYPKYDNSLCTYCSGLTGAILTSVAFAWKGEPWSDVEILTGKRMKPTPGKKSVLVGKCLYQAHKDHPEIAKMKVIKTCPPSPEAIVTALHDLGVDINPQILLNLETAPGFFMRKYEGKPEFDESFFQIRK